MIGYHYTPLSAWKKIKKEGLQLYPMRSHIVEAMKKGGVVDDDNIMGIWVWKKEPKGTDELGNILYQVSEKTEMKIAKIKVHYKEEDRYRDNNGRHTNTFHRGAIGKLVYHEECEAEILTNPIKKVELIKVFDVLKVLSQ